MSDSSSLQFVLSESRPVRRVWEFGFNTCHAPIVMRNDVRSQIRRAHEELGMRYWRCHGTLSDDVGVLVRNGDNKNYFCFSGLKRILDAGLQQGVKPFLEFSFMPSALAAAPNEVITHYRAVVSPPSDFRAWRRLIRRTMEFLASSYGVAELRRWYFEIWNEPNIPFWSGDQAAYFRLYREAVLAIKAIDPALRAGGPATARGEWVADLLRFCEATRTPIDFVSTHIYPSDVPFMEQAHGRVRLLGLNFLCDQFARIRREVDAAQFRGPIFWGEWNSSAGPLAENHDECNNAALIAGALSGMEEYSDGSLFWNLTDIYEECGYHFAPFHGGYGLYTVDDVPKSAARAFGLFRRLQARRVPISGLPRSHARGAMATASRDKKKMAIILWNHREKGAGRPWRASLDLSDLHLKEAIRTAILPGRGSAYESWNKMNRPMNLSGGNLRKLHAASRPALEAKAFSESPASLPVVVAPGSAQLLELQLR